MAKTEATVKKVAVRGRPMREMKDYEIYEAAVEAAEKAAICPAGHVFGEATSKTKDCGKQECTRVVWEACDNKREALKESAKVCPVGLILGVDLDKLRRCRNCGVRKLCEDKYDRIKIKKLLGSRKA